MPCRCSQGQAQGAGRPRDRLQAHGQEPAHHSEADARTVKARRGASLRDSSWEVSAYTGRSACHSIPYKVLCTDRRISLQILMTAGLPGHAAEHPGIVKSVGELQGPKPSLSPENAHVQKGCDTCICLSQQVACLGRVACMDSSSRRPAGWSSSMLHVSVMEQQLGSQPMQRGFKTSGSSSAFVSAYRSLSSAFGALLHSPSEQPLVQQTSALQGAIRGRACMVTESLF